MPAESASHPRGPVGKTGRPTEATLRSPRTVTSGPAGRPTGRPRRTSSYARPPEVEACAEIPNGDDRMNASSKTLLIWSAAVWLGFFVATTARADTRTVYVSPDGNDAWSGKLPAPNADARRRPGRHSGPGA